MDDDPYDLERFVAAQDSDATVERAIEELRLGHKTSHWMWFVFPQLAGLGRSAAAQRYAISGVAQARSYLEHPVLGARLVECTRALTARQEDDPVDILGPVDAQKLALPA